MRTKFKAWTLPYLQEHKEVQFDVSNIDDYQNNFYIEIGSGKGKFLIDISRKFNNYYFLGIEKNVTCSGIIAKKLVDEKIENAKLLNIDVSKFFSLVKDNSVDGIFLNFSDPWPKKRHEKRRLTFISFLNEYYRILKLNKKVYIKTDQLNLYQFSLENIEKTKFKLINKSENYINLDEFDAISEYEQNFREMNLPIYRIVIEK